jgi:hypothetical protein
MASVNVSVNAISLSTSDLYDVVDLTFNYAGTTLQNGTIIYYAAHLSDGTVTDDVLFPYTVITATDIPASTEIAYTPTVTFTAPITATLGKVFYTA